MAGIDKICSHLNAWGIIWSCYINPGDGSQQPISSPTAIGPGAQPGFNWQGFAGSRPQNHYYNRPNPTMTSPTSTVPSSAYPGKARLGLCCIFRLTGS